MKKLMRVAALIGGASVLTVGLGGIGTAHAGAAGAVMVMTSAKPRTPEQTPTAQPVQTKQSPAVLIMIFSTSSSNGGTGVVQQEFSSAERCEAARVHLQSAHVDYSNVLRAQGCFAK